MTSTYPINRESDMKGVEMSKRFRVLDYKAELGDGKWVDNVIGWGTKLLNFWDSKTWKLPAYSHSEIWIPDEQGRFVDDDGNYCGHTYSSTMGQIRGSGGQGMRKLPASKTLHNAGRWDYTEYEVSDAAYERAVKMAEGAVLTNAGYGKRDIAKFIPGIRHLIPTDDRRYICSEFVYSFLIYAGIFELPYKVISPLKLASLMERRSLV